MDILKHKKEFDEIIQKYKLFEGQKAQEIAEFLTSGTSSISAQEFAKKYEMQIEEAKIFLSFIQKGIEFRESTKNQ